MKEECKSAKRQDDDGGRQADFPCKAILPGGTRLSTQNDLQFTRNQWHHNLTCTCSKAEPRRQRKFIVDPALLSERGRSMRARPIAHHNIAKSVTHIIMNGFTGNATTSVERTFRREAKATHVIRLRT
jgi:hypothetical protein